LNDSRGGHLSVEIVAFPGALADPGEYRHTAMQLGDVVYQLHDDHCLTHTSDAKRSDLSAFQKRTDQVNHLDAGGEHLGRSRLVRGFRRGAMDGIMFSGADRSAFVDRMATTVEYPPQHPFSNGHRDGRACVGDLVTPLETFGAGHGDRPDPLVPKMLLH